ncbi:MAG: hypothetical protein ACLGGX_09325 [Bdellovibrionia bacterium]
MNKRELIQKFITELEAELANLEAQIKANKEEATHEESKPENEYDTRALEMGYLVKAQSKRILDAKETLAAFKHTPVRDFDSSTPIAATALIELDLNGKSQWFLYMPSGGGVSVNFSGQKVQVMTPSSPLGGALLSLKQGDIATLESGKEIKEYEILSVQ